MAEESKELRGFKLPSECVDNYVDGGQSKVTECELINEKGKLQFQESLRSVSELNHPRSINRFHPTLPVLACGVNREVILFSAADGSIAFRYWQESRVKLRKRQTSTEFSYLAAIEWNVCFNFFLFLNSWSTSLQKYWKQIEIMFRFFYLFVRLMELYWQPVTMTAELSCGVIRKAQYFLKQGNTQLIQWLETSSGIHSVMTYCQLGILWVKCFCFSLPLIDWLKKTCSMDNGHHYPTPSTSSGHAHFVLLYFQIGNFVHHRAVKKNKTICLSYRNTHFLWLKSP